MIIINGFFSGEKLDKYIISNFSSLHEKALMGKVKANSTKEKLGLIILLDQFSRHIYRSTEKAFSGDDISLEIAKNLVKSGEIESLSPTELIFALMPFQHSENIDDKEILLNIAETKLQISPEKDINTYKQLINHTNGHKEVLIKFGRYPKRNKALGRISTDNEIEYIFENPNSAY